MLSPQATKTGSGKAFGTLAGKGLSNDWTVAWNTATDSTYSIRKTSNKKATGEYSSCDTSYLMITGLLMGGSAKTVKLNVTSTAFGKTMEEKITKRPDAVKAPIAAPVQSPYAEDSRKLQTFIGGLTAAGMLITTSGLW